MTGGGPQPRLLSLFDEEPVVVGDEPIRWVPVRRLLGIGAFGINAYRAGAGEAVIEDHVESPGQEEVYVVLSGQAAFTVGEERFDLGPGQALFVPNPEARRAATALAADTAVLAIGGWRDQPYHSLPWEPLYLSSRPFKEGQWTETIEVLDREAGGYRDHPFVRYRVACCLAQLGETDAALAEFQAAIERRPELLERGASDDRLAPLRELSGWPASD
jgi:uncharacterized cupin superfamily protein